MYSQYQDLERKRKIVKNDKAKIAELIEELDQMKNEALKVAWQKVDEVSCHCTCTCICTVLHVHCGEYHYYIQWNLS